MKRDASNANAKSASPPRPSTGVILAVTLVVLAAAIFFTARHVRHNTRQQILGRDGEILNAVARVQADRVAEDLAQLEDLGTLEDAENQMLVLLETSRLTGGALGARLYDTEGRLRDTFPADLIETTLDPGFLPALRALRPASAFTPAMPLHDVFYPASLPEDDLYRATPLLEVNVPLHTSAERRLLGVAQFLIQGQAIAQEFRRLDRNLFILGGVIFALGGSILGGTVAWSLRRLNRANALLARRTRDLVQANQELTLAAKSSAVGAVTSHLIHGLKSPLSGLQHFVQRLDAQASTAPGTPGTEWQQAVDTTRRMQSMINQVVAVLREQDGQLQYEVTLAELAGLMNSRFAPMIRTPGPRLKLDTRAEGSLDNRTANLVALILANLLQNAFQATPDGGEVRLVTQREDHAFLWEVRDQGPGIPDAVRGALFTPCRSTREDGSGIGLAISKQLAAHLGATLELAEDTPQGCVFRLKLKAEG